MIINSLQNIALYTPAYTHLQEFIDYYTKHKFDLLVTGKNEISENLYIVKNFGDKKSDFEGTLEVHREWVDIHIPLTDDEIIAFKALVDCELIEKEYDAENDYMLYNESDISQVTLAKGYFAIIDTTMAHMAMLGEGSMTKLIVKLRK